MLSGIGATYWSECVKTSVRLIYSMSTTILHQCFPCDVLYHEKQPLHQLRAFDFLCYVSSTITKRNKFMPWAHPCIFIGYPFGKKDYKLLNLVTKDIFISRDVNFFFEKLFLLPSLKMQTVFIHAFFYSKCVHWVLWSSTCFILYSILYLYLPHILHYLQLHQITFPYDKLLVFVNLLLNYMIMNVILEEEPFTCHHTVTNLYLTDSLSHSPIPITEFIFHTQNYTTRTHIL